MQVRWSRATEYGGVAVLVAVLTPLLYLSFRHLLLVYGMVWLLMLSIGPMSKKYPWTRLAQLSLFIALLFSMLIAMLTK